MEMSLRQPDSAGGFGVLWRIMIVSNVYVGRREEWTRVWFVSDKQGVGVCHWSFVIDGERFQDKGDTFAFEHRVPFFWTPDFVA